MTENDDRVAEESQASETQDAVLEHCSKCSTLLDVTGCHPLMETACPSCGALIKVLREFHHFVLLSEIGRGGSGSVYRAFDETLERDVALKLLRTDNLRDPDFLASLETEALITGSINHPHVVKVYSTGRKNGLYYIAMEIVSGGSLSERIDRQGRMSEAVVHGLGIQIAEGLQAAYSRGLLHRDVKPGNILFVDKETVKVADFGLALPLEQARGDSTEIWGTPDYIAPEKLLQQGEDIRSDIYSLGCTLFHCLTGRPPFDTQSVQALIQNQTTQIAPSVQTFAADVSGATSFVIKRCLEKNPADRYQTYHELIEHLKYANEQKTDASQSAAAKTQKLAKADEAVSEAKPWGWGVAIASAAIALGVLVAGFFIVQHFRANKITEAGRIAAKTAAAPVPPSAPAPSAEPPVPAVSAKAPSLPKAAEYRILDLRTAYTADTRRGLFMGAQTPTDTLVFTQYGIIKANGVPFELVDPEHSPSGFNVIMLKGGSRPFPPKVDLRVPSQSISRLHFLGGIAGWGWSPDKNQQYFDQPIVKFTVVHASGANEEFIFKNGVEFANHPRRVDVPGSTFAAGVTSNGHQVRTFSVAVSNRAPVVKLTMESLHPGIAPVFVAITAEVAGE